jgi:DNA invertase Pin-like site-specific DNA recombinase
MGAGGLLCRQRQVRIQRQATPRWDRLLADIEAGKIDATAAWDQDRSRRMMSDLEELRKFFTKLGRKIPLATTGQGDVGLYSLP